MPARVIIPYCGLPVDPQTLLRHWNLDPVLIGCLLAGLFVYVFANRSLEGRTKLLFCAGWILATLALISPLCALSVSLFSARIGQHLILATLATPLLALGLPRAHGVLSRPLPAAIFFTLMLWLWEAPAPYALTFSSTTIYWLMHTSVVISALWLWLALINGPAASAIVAATASMMQMSLLGALLTFAPHPLYAWHLSTTNAYGLSPLEDQQLGGILMWVPGAVPFVAVALMLAARFLSPTMRPAS